MKHLLAFVALVLVLFCAGRECQAYYVTGNAPFINTWLLAGPFDNSADNSAFTQDFVFESKVRPVQDAQWKYFDDRLFSRNYDDYQDLFSYLVVVRDGSAASKVLYAHVYVFSPKNVQGELRIGADSEFVAWVNGSRVSSGVEECCNKDKVKAGIALKTGWNSVLLKVGNRAEGLLGFYARICDAKGNALPNLVYSINGGAGKLSVTTSALSGVKSSNMPTAYRGWTYVGFVIPYVDEFAKRWPEGNSLEYLWPQASDFVLNASGGAAPYKWSITKGHLPSGLKLNARGRITGAIVGNTKVGSYAFTICVSDSSGGRATKQLAITVKERPNKWYEEARMVALIHSPEDTPGGDFDGLARLMKLQGYAIGMPISYGNGDYIFRWPSRFEPNNALGDVDGKLKAALTAQSIKFGMYIGNTHDCPQFTYPQLILMLEDAVKKYQPAAFWFDWSGVEMRSTDAIYSMIKSYDPNTLVVLNGMTRPQQGDWDVICIEDMSYGDYSRIWDSWPGVFNYHTFPMVYNWPKAGAIETWRLMLNPKLMAGEVIRPDLKNFSVPDWKDMLRLQISIIGAGYIANMDHSPAVGATPGSIKELSGSPILEVHRKMGDWANPAGLPTLLTSYTQVNPGPLAKAAWGYNTINIPRNTIYLHFIKNPVGKTGLPNAGAITVGPINSKVIKATWMNTGKAANFAQKGKNLVISLTGIQADPVDTIISLKLAKALPEPASTTVKLPLVIPKPKPGNLAAGKKATLLSLDGSHELAPSSFTSYASKAVDSDVETVAQGAWEWDWTLQVDLLAEYDVSRIVWISGGSYATEFKVNVSRDGKTWDTIAWDKNATGDTREFKFPSQKLRYVRILGIKPDGQNQPGGQMSVAELEVYNK